MTGVRAGSRPRRSRKARAAGIAFLAIVLLAVLLRVNPLPDVPVSLPFPLPPLFWLFVLLVVALGLVAHASLKERERLARRESLAGAVDDREPELRPHGPVPSGGDADVIEARSRAPARVPAAAGGMEGEMSRLVEWIEGVAAKISEGSGDVMDSRTAPHSLGERQDEESHPPTMATSLPRIGGWSDLRARSAIEKFLRKRPWAPAGDIAKALGMEIGLATRVSGSLREESVR